MIDFARSKSGQQSQRAQTLARGKTHHIKCLAAFHGHLPLLQELSDTDFDKPNTTEEAGKFTVSYVFFFVLASYFLLYFSS